jgi:uncharacterized protein with PIN domain
MKFVADHMLGTLARWLRFMGYDTVYPPPESDDELISIAKKQKRMILTHDKKVGSNKITKAIYIKSDKLNEQIKQVISELSLGVDKNTLSRCAVCNTKIIQVNRRSVEGKVPSGVFFRRRKFWKCPTCGRYYWHGTHWQKIIKNINKFKTMKRRYKNG